MRHVPHSPALPEKNRLAAERVRRWAARGETKRGRQRDDRATYFVVSATQRLQSICAAIETSLVVAERDASRVAKISDRLEKLMKQGLAVLANAELYERQADPGARKRYQETATRLRALGRRVGGMSPPLMDTLGRLLKQMEKQTKTHKSLYKDLNFILEKDPAYRMPPQSVTVAPPMGQTVLALLAVVLVYLRRRDS